MEKGLAIITGADGGMGQVITAALAKEGYPVIMACLDPKKAVPVCTRIQQETGNTQIEVREINLASLSSVNNFTGQLLKEGRPVSLLMNNAGILTTPVRKTEDGLETIVSVNYVAPYMLTRQLLPLMQPGCRIVNTVSCTYAIGRIEPDFFEKGKNRHFFRIPVYGNTKLALLLFTQELAKRIQDKGITINASDPGIVSTNMITMQAWFDPLTDILFRPFIKHRPKVRQPPSTWLFRMRRKIKTVVVMPIVKRGMCRNASGIIHSKNNFGTIRKSCSGKKESGSEPACTFSFIPMKLLFHAYETTVPCRGNFSFMPMKLKIHADKILQI